MASGGSGRVNKLNDLNGKEWVKSTKSWIVVDGKKSDITKEIENHPASFPPKLVEHFINFFTKKDQTVLDPFLGIGSTLEACYNTERNCVGIELNKRYAKYSKKRADALLLNGKLIEKRVDLRVINADCRDALKHSIPKIDFCITSPPYWNMLRTSRGNVKSTLKKRKEMGFDEYYGNDPRDAGNIENYQEYLSFIEDVFGKTHALLKEEGYVVIVVQNVRNKEGKMIPVAWDIAKQLSKQYSLKQEFIWCQNQKALGCWGYPSTYVSNVHHHYALVLQKAKVI